MAAHPKIANVPGMVHGSVMGRVWINGAVRDARDPVLTPDCAGLLIGRGVFETLLGRNGEPVFLPRHLRRLASGTERLGLPMPDPVLVELALRMMMVENDLATGKARLRITVVPGTVLVSAASWVDYPSAAAIVTSPFLRNERSALAGIKTTSYAENLLTLEEARRRGGDEAILANSRGELCEGATTNLFLVEDGVVITPPLDSGCLPGVMREVVLEVCHAQGIPAREEARSIGALGDCCEAFLTSSLRGVQTVGMIDGRPVESPGETTQRIGAALALW